MCEKYRLQEGAKNIRMLDSSAFSEIVCYNKHMHKRPLAIIFDCFGVMYRDAFLDFMDAHRHHLLHPESYYQDLSDQCDKGALKPSALYQAFSEVTGESVAVVQRRVEESIHSLNHETIGIVQALKHRYRLGLLSNIDRTLLDTVLKAEHVNRLFDTIVASSDVGSLKPNREIFQAMADKLHIPFDQWLFIDDRIANVQGATQHGIPSYHFTSASDLQAYLRHSGILTPAYARK